MPCNCGKAGKFEVLHSDGSVTKGYTSEMQAKIAAAKLGGGVVRPEVVEAKATA